MSVNNEQANINSINSKKTEEEDNDNNSNNSEYDDEDDDDDEFQDELGLFTDDDEYSLNNDTDDDHDEQPHDLKKKRNTFSFSKLSISTSSIDYKTSKPKQPHIIYFNMDSTCSSNREVGCLFFLN